MNLQSQKSLKQSKKAQLRTKQETLKKLKESLSWERDYIPPQVPPPSRNSSRTPSSVNLSVQDPSKNIYSKNEQQLVRRSQKTEKNNETKDTVNRAKFVSKKSKSIVNQNDCLLKNEKILSPSQGFILNIMDKNITDKSQVEVDKQPSPNSSKLLVSLKNSATSASLLPSVTNLNISKNIYQFRQPRFANSIIGKAERKEEILGKCSQETMQSNISSRTEDGDNRNDIGAISEETNEVTSARDEIGSKHQRRQRTPKDEARNSTSVEKQDGDGCSPCQENKSDNYVGKKENVVIEIRRHNAIKQYKNNKTTTTKKENNKKNFKKNLTNDSSKKQGEKMFLSKSGKTLSVGEDTGICIAWDDTNVESVAKDGNVAKDDVILIDVTTEQNYLCNNTATSCGKRKDYKSHLASPSPLCLPSPIQMKDFEVNTKRKRKQKFIKMRRKRNNYQKSFQSDFPNNDSY